VEWLSTESQAYIELSRNEGQLSAGARGFWNPSSAELFAETPAEAAGGAEPKGTDKHDGAE
jgi:hypothetical protein